MNPNSEILVSGNILHVGPLGGISYNANVDIHPTALAETLSHINRFSGNVGPYSVLTHSLLVAHTVSAGPWPLPPLFTLAALMHDASEVVLGDIPRPVKRHLHPIRIIESNINRGIWRLTLGPDIPYPSKPIRRAVKIADNLACAFEMSQLIPPWALKNFAPATQNWVRDAASEYHEKLRVTHLNRVQTTRTYAIEVFDIAVRYLVESIATGVLDHNTVKWFNQATRYILFGGVPRPTLEPLS